MWEISFLKVLCKNIYQSSMKNASAFLLKLDLGIYEYCEQWIY